MNIRFGAVIKPVLMFLSLSVCTDTHVVLTEAGRN